MATNPIGNKQNQPSPKTSSNAGRRIKLIVMFFTFIPLVVLTALMFILRANDKPLILAAIDYVTGKGVGVKEINKVDQGVLDLLDKTVNEITNVGKKIDDFTSELQSINDIKKIEEFISTVRLEKNNVVKARSRILGIKNECEGRELANLNMVDLDTAIENSKIKETNLSKIEEAAYAKMDELQKKGREDEEVMISVKNPEPKQAEPNQAEINISMKLDASTKTTVIQINDQVANNKEELERLLRAALGDYLKSGKDVIAVVNADSAVPDQEITDLSTICKNVQIEKINFRKEKGDE